MTPGLIITNLASKVIEAKVITASHIGTKIYIPSIIIQVTKTK